MQLLDVVLGERDVLPGREDQFHHLGIARHFLLVAGVEGLDSRLESSRSTSRSDSLLPSMRVEEPMLSMVATRRRPTAARAPACQGSPCALELVDFAISPSISGVM